MRAGLLALCAMVVLASLVAGAAAADMTPSSSRSFGSAAAHVGRKLLETSSTCTTSTSTNSTAPSTDDIHRYQIVLWFSVGFVLVAISSVWALATMSFKRDTMLYSSFNPNWEDRKRR